MGRLVEIAVFHDREEAVVALAALDSADLFVVMFGADVVANAPDLRGIVAYRPYGLDDEREAVRDLLAWRPDDWRPSLPTRFLSAPVFNALLAFVAFMSGVPYLKRSSQW